MATRKEVMQKLVKEEARNLKKFATKEEINKLGVRALDPESKYSCVYGLMTGNCFSERAVELIEKSCKRVYNKGRLNGVEDAKVNGSPKNKDRNEYGPCKYYSPIEVFIYQYENRENGNNERLIKYLKGEIKTLRFV